MDGRRDPSEDGREKQLRADNSSSLVSLSLHRGCNRMLLEPSGVDGVALVVFKHRRERPHKVLCQGQVYTITPIIIMNKLSLHGSKKCHFQR